MSSDVLGLRLKVRPDVFFVRSQDGVWLRNNVGSFSLRGANAYELVRGLFEQLDGTRSFADACDNLGVKEAEAFYRRLMVPLIERGFVRKVTAEASPLAEDLALRFAEHLAFLELYVEDPVATLARLRRHEIICIGSGSQLRAMAVALAELGFLAVRLFAAEGCAETSNALEEIVAAVGRIDEEATWALHAVPQSFDLAQIAKRAVDGSSGQCVVIATDASAYRTDLAAACSWLSSQKRRVLVAAPTESHVLATPILDGDRACIECILMSVVEGEAQPAGPAAVSLAALQVAQRLFSFIIGEPVPQDATLTTINGATLLVRSHSVRQHERCSTHRARAVRRWSPDQNAGATENDVVRPNISRPNDPEALVSLQDRLVETVARWVDPLTGPLLAVSEDNLDQLPLAASRCRSPGAGSGASREPETVIDCLGYCARETRNQVVLSAIEDMVQALLQELPERVSVQGIGAGWSFGEAVYRALAIATLRSESRDDQPASRTEASWTAGPSERVSFLRQSLSEFEPGDVSAYETSSSYGLIRVELEVAGRHLARGVGVHASEALEHALLGALARQVSESRQAKTVVVHPAPQAERWGPVMDGVVERALKDHAFVSLGHVVPFVGNDLVVIGVVPREEGAGRRA